MPPQQYLHYNPLNWQFSHYASPAISPPFLRLLNWMQPLNTMFTNSEMRNKLWSAIWPSFFISRLVEYLCHGSMHIISWFTAQYFMVQCPLSHGWFVSYLHHIKLYFLPTFTTQISPISTPHLHHNYPTFTPHLHHIYTTLTPHLHHIYTTITPHLPSISPTLTPHLTPISTPNTGWIQTLQTTFAWHLSS